MPAKTGARLRVKQVRSGIGRPALHRRTLAALGLKHHQDIVEVTDSPAIRGMLYQVRHLVEVTPVGGK
jgi:large subunit ribosomal protein L30